MSLVFEHYDIATKTQSFVYCDVLVKQKVWKRHPYSWYFSPMKDKIDSGEITWFGWEKEMDIRELVA